MLEYVLTIFFGGLGYYRFKKNQIGLGLLYLFTFGLFFIGWIFDIKECEKEYYDPYMKKLQEKRFTETNIELEDYDWGSQFNNIEMISYLKDVERYYKKYSKNEELKTILRNFVNKKIKYGLYLEYYYLNDYYGDVSISEVFSSYDYSVKNVKDFFNINYVNCYGFAPPASNTQTYFDNFYIMENEFYDMIKKSLYKNEYERIICNQFMEFNKLFNTLTDVDKIENSNASKGTILIIINELYKEKLKSETEKFIEKYNINIGCHSMEIAKQFLSNNSFIDTYALADYLAMIDYEKTLSLTNQILLYLDVVHVYQDTINKENYLARLAINDDSTKITIGDIDIMSGSEFEQYIAKLFKSYGYKTEVTKASGDQGIDVIAEKNGIKYAIQAKCYNSPVGNHAIMEAVAGAKYYDADQIMVITNNTFTKSAIELAKKNNVHLWDRKVLIEKISEGIN